MARRKTLRLWVWQDIHPRRRLSLEVSVAKPKWYPPEEWLPYGEYWADLNAGHFEYREKRIVLKLLRAFGLRSLPPRGTAWLVEVAAPGRSRVVRRVKGGE